MYTFPDKTVRVNCVAPGWIETGMNAPLLANPALAQRVVERVPLGRWGDVNDVVGPVLFLASAAARDITSHLLPILRRRQQHHPADTLNSCRPRRNCAGGTSNCFRNARLNAASD